MSALEIHLSLRGVLLPPLSSGRGVCLSPGRGGGGGGGGS